MRLLATLDLSLIDTTADAKKKVNKDSSNSYFERDVTYVEANNLYMVLDQYQPCSEFKMGLGSSSNVSTTCNPSNGNTRDLVFPDNVLFVGESMYFELDVQL